MPRSTNPSGWPCPHCRYDLRGLVPEDGSVRCPECGRETSILETIQRRRRREQEGHLLFKLCAGTVAIVMLLFLIADDRIPGLHMWMIWTAAIAGVLIHVIGVRIMCYRIHVHEIVIFLVYVLAIFLLYENGLIGYGAWRFLLSLGGFGFLGLIALREWRMIGDWY